MEAPRGWQGQHPSQGQGPLSHGPEIHQSLRGVHRYRHSPLFVSIVKSYLHREDEGHHFYILQGASYQGEFGYREELEGLAISHPDVITYVPTVSRPQEERNLGWTGETGRVSLIVEEYLDKFGLSPESTRVYACGHPRMIEDVKVRVTPKGFKVIEERF